jgi:hypothetical protein
MDDGGERVHGVVAVVAPLDQLDLAVDALQPTSGQAELDSGDDAVQVGSDLGANLMKADCDRVEPR